MRARSAAFVVAIASAAMLSSYPALQFTWPNSPETNYVDTLVNNKLKKLRIEPSGRVNVYIAGGSTGNSIETTVVQLAETLL